MNNRIAWIAALALAAFGSAAEAQTITAVYTTYSDTGVPTKLDITGTAFCTTTPCGTKAPVVRLAGNIVAISGSSPTGIGVPLTGQPDGDYLLSVTPYGKSAITYAFTLKSKTGGMAGPQGPIGPVGPAGPPGSPGLPGQQGPAGPKGDTGAAGAPGSAGAPGAKGDKGDKGDGLTFLGAWNLSTAYKANDVVTAGGSTYLALSTSTAVDPLTDTGTAWALLAAKGADGAKGDIGPAGAVGAVGPAGPPGVPGTNGVDGSPGLPGAPGAKGDKGDNGLQGVPGPSLEQWSSTGIYSAGALVYTNTDPFGRDRFCVYYAVNQNSDKDPRENSASLANSAWAAVDDTCQTGSAPPPPGAGYTLGGTLSGLAGATSVTLSLTVDGTVTTSILNANGGFTLPRRVALGSTYAVAITVQPVGGNCNVVNSSGTVAGTISNVTVSCGVLSSIIQSLEIYNSSPTAAIGYPRQFAVNGVAPNGRRTDLTLAATWSSSNPAIATVGASTGQVIGVAVGQVAVSVSYEGLSASVDVSVLDVPLVSTLAGSGKVGSADGIGENADFWAPQSLTVDSSGKVFVADTANNVIRTIDPRSRIVTTIAGLASGPAHVDGPGSSARFSVPEGLAFGPSGDLFVADQCSIRKISFSGDNVSVSTLVGSDVCGYVDSAPGATDGEGVRFFSNRDIAVDSFGNLYVTDSGNNVVRKVLPSGVTSTLAGSVKRDFVDGLGKDASFNTPWAIAVDSLGNLFVSDINNASIRKITPEGLVTTANRGIGVVYSAFISPDQRLYITTPCTIRSANLAAPSLIFDVSVGNCGDGVKNGPITEAWFNWFPQDVTIDLNGIMYVVEAEPSHDIRRISRAP